MQATRSELADATPEIVNELHEKATCYVTLVSSPQIHSFRGRFSTGFLHPTAGESIQVMFMFKWTDCATFKVALKDNGERL